MDETRSLEDLAVIWMCRGMPVMAMVGLEGVQAVAEVEAEAGEEAVATVAGGCHLGGHRGSHLHFPPRRVVHQGHG